MKRGRLEVLTIVLVLLLVLVGFSLFDVSRFFSNLFDKFDLTGEVSYGSSAFCGNGVIDTGEGCDIAMSAQEIDMYCTQGSYVPKGWSCNACDCISPDTSAFIKN